MKRKNQLLYMILLLSGIHCLNGVQEEVLEEVQEEVQRKEVPSLVSLAEAVIVNDNWIMDSLLLDLTGPTPFLKIKVEERRKDLESQALEEWGKELADRNVNYTSSRKLVMPSLSLGFYEGLLDIRYPDLYKQALKNGTVVLNFSIEDILATISESTDCHNIELPYCVDIHNPHEIFKKYGITSLKGLPCFKARFGKDLRVINLSENNIKLIDKDDLKGLRIKKLLLKNSNIEFIHPEAFCGVAYLKDLNLKGNKITNIHPDTFNSLKHLESLDLSENLIKKIHKESFNVKKRLRRLNLHGNQIEDIEPGSLKDLSRLDISDNKMNVIKKGSFNRVEQLNLAGNPIEKIEDDAFKSVRNVCGVEEVPE